MRSYRLVSTASTPHVRSSAVTSVCIRAHASVDGRVGIFHEDLLRIILYSNATVMITLISQHHGTARGGGGLAMSVSILSNVWRVASFNLNATGPCEPLVYPELATFMPISPCVIP